jgi:hypothetical protein
MKAPTTYRLLFLAFIPSAHAYIDPGSGSFLLQMALASAIGGMLTIKMYFNSFKAKLKSILGLKPKNEDPSQQP